MDKIDIVYYINLDYRTDRKQEFLEWIEESGFPESKVQRISAVHTPGRGHHGCLLSHTKAVETFIASGKDNCIIFEDDYVPLDTKLYWANYQKLFDSSKKFDVVMGSYNVLESVETDIDFLRKVSQSYTASCYLITKEFAPKLLALWKECKDLMIQEENITQNKTHNYMNDVYWCKLMTQSEWFCFYPRIGVQRPSFSDLQNHYTSYNA